MDRTTDQLLLERVQALKPIAEGLGLTLAQLALAWVLREENVAQIEEIVGDSALYEPAASLGLRD